MWAIVADNCSRAVPVATIDDVQRPSRQVIEEVAQAAGATILDPRGYFCVSGECSTQHDGENVYRDATHITVGASWSLGPYFVEALRKAF